MPFMKVDRTLRSTPGGEALMVAPTGQPVKILATEGGFTQVELIRLPLRPIGWVSSDAVDTSPSVEGPIDKTAFVRACFRQALLFGVNAHYLAGIAELRSRVTAGAQNGRIGPFGITPAEWDAFRTDAEFEVAFGSSDITDWTAQCVVFALMTHRAEDRLSSLLGHRESATELYLAQLIGPAAAFASLRKPEILVADVLGQVPVADLPAGGLTADQLIDRDRDFLKATGTEAAQRISAALKQALDAVAPLVAQASVDILGDADAEVAPTSAKAAQLNLRSLQSPRLDMARLIVSAFATAGFGTLQQAAALANAIDESNLDPKARAPKPPTEKEDSVGLFQLNRQGGLGAGFSVPDLQDPNVNIARVIKEAQRFPAFAAAASLREAVNVFVARIEKPKDAPAAVSKRLKTAQSLLA
ncbi:MAG TPA: phage tail tip lysozyme [Acetobacteraceae bacterium]|nr:phage tail tip lysozyme [Acetobacteraceae bacterium]